MKKMTYWLCFAGGFVAFFLPFPLLPNGWIFIIGPFIGIYDSIQIVIYAPFLLACILAICKIKWASGWVLGSVVAAATGLLLAFTIGLGFVHV